MAAATSTSSNIFSLSSSLSFPKTQNSKPHFPSSLTSKTQVSFPSIIRKGLSLIIAMGTYNVQVVVEDNEPEERLLSRFRREVMKAGVIQECKRRRFFENAHDEKKRKSREAARKNRKRRYVPRVPKQNTTTETPKKEDDDFDDDNWDLPEGDLPY